MEELGSLTTLLAPPLSCLNRRVRLDDPDEGLELRRRPAPTAAAVEEGTLADPDEGSALATLTEVSPQTSAAAVESADPSALDDRGSCISSGATAAVDRGRGAVITPPPGTGAAPIAGPGGADSPSPASSLAALRWIDSSRSASCSRISSARLRSDRLGSWWWWCGGW
jgi:hypothetical protein